MSSEYLIQSKYFLPPIDRWLDNSPIPSNKAILIDDQAISDQELADAVQNSISLQSEYGALISATVGSPNFLPFYFFEKGQRMGNAVCRIAMQRDFHDFSTSVQKILDFENSGTATSFTFSIEELKEIFFMTTEAENELFRDLPSGRPPSSVLANLTETQFDQLFKKIVPIGTGFLVGLKYLLTNHHVIPDLETAAKCVAQFDEGMDEFGRITNSIDYRFDSSFIISGRTNDTDPLDYSLLKLESRSVDNRVDLLTQGLGFLRLDQRINVAPNLSIEQLQRLSILLGTKMEFFENAAFAGDPVNIIQHPKGRFKKAVVSSNRVTKLGTNFMRYEANADFGSSGAPVFNQNWDLVAIQHCAVGVLDEAGQVIIKKFSDGRRRIKVSAQQGVRISKIIQDLVNKRNSSDELKAFLKEYVQLSNSIDDIPAVPNKPIPETIPGQWLPGIDGVLQWSRNVLE